MAEVYSTAWIEEAKDKLKTLFDSLIVSMTADNPKPEYVYEHHNVAKIYLNAITFDIEGIEEDLASIEVVSQTLNRFLISFTIRVHTSYQPNGIRDGQINARLLNSVANKLIENRDLGDNYRIETIDDMVVNEAFVATYGGQMRGVVSAIVEAAQE